MLLEPYVSRIKLEIDEINELQRAYQPLLSLSRSKQPDLIETAALAQVLHSFYNGIERLFVLTMKASNQELPVGANWHRTLLEKVTESTDARAPVISKTTRDKLVEYLGFRHVVRHTYSRHLDSDRIKVLADKSGDVWTALREEVLLFLRSGTP